MSKANLSALILLILKRNEPNLIKGYLVDQQYLKKVIKRYCYKKYTFDENILKECLNDLKESGSILYANDNPTRSLQRLGDYWQINFYKYISDILSNGQIQSFNYIYSEFKKLNLVKNPQDYMIQDFLDTFNSKSSDFKISLVKFNTDSGLKKYQLIKSIK
jgi:hypothetical protein